MKKISTILIITVCLILSGCINEESLHKEREKGDLKIEISTDKDKYNMSTENININVMISNIAEENIRIESHYKTLVHFLIFKNGTKIIPTQSETDLNKVNWIVLMSNEKINYTINLLDKEPFYDQNGNIYEFPSIGSYTIYALYEHIADSEKIYFEIS